MTASLSFAFRKARVLQSLGNLYVTTAPQTYQARRHLFKYLNSALNIFDRDRYKEVGPERLCAEWVLKVGGRMRWVGADKWLTDYNSLPPETTKEHLCVQDIDVSGTAVMLHGFEHLINCEQIRSLKLDNCKYVDDRCLKQLQYLLGSLQMLQISTNKKITDQGLLYLEELIHLTDLHLKDLPGVKDKKGTLEKLQKALPKCDIIFLDVEKLT